MGIQPYTFAIQMRVAITRKEIIVALTAAAILCLFFAGNRSGQNPEPWTTPFLLPEQMNFCGEPVPLKDPEVYERMDKELLGNAFWQSSNLMHLKRMSRYFPEIELILQNNGLPDDIKYLAVAESGLSGAVSPVGAAGFWQFMPQTGKQYGLEITEEVDERYHLTKSTEAACKYLKDMFQIFGNWTLSAAAYNCGVGGIQKNMSFQKVSSYYDLHLNSETSRYIFRILALKEILSNPGKYHYLLPGGTEYKTHQTVMVNVSGAISNWATWAISHGTNYKMLRYLNPWIRKSNLTNPLEKTYQVAIPFGEIPVSIDEKLVQKLDREAADTSSILHQFEAQEEYSIYIVEKPDNIDNIAQKIKMSPSDLMRWNNLRSPYVKKGQKLKYLTSKGL